MTPADQLLLHLTLVERISASVTRRHRCTPQDAEEFASIVKVKLIENDYAVLRKFQERSSLSTYLNTVIHRLFLDWRNKQWGRWRPSVAARRLGPAAVMVERLVCRDGHSITSALQMTELAHGSGSVAGLEQLLTSAGRRTGRPRAVGDEELVSIPARERADALILDAERAQRRNRVARELDGALARMRAEDRLLVQLCVLESLGVTRAARLLGLPAKPLYRRLETLLKALRHELERQGVRQQDVDELLDHDSVERTRRPVQSETGSGGRLST